MAEPDCVLAEIDFDKFKEALGGDLKTAQTKSNQLNSVGNIPLFRILSDDKIEFLQNNLKVEKFQNGKKIINHRQRLLNLQKRQKLKDLLITKFMQKYGIKNADEILEEEIGKFLQGEKLNDQDLRRLDNKIRNLLKEKATKERLKEKLTQSLQGIPSNTKDILPKIDSNNIEENTISPKIINPQPRILNTEPSNTLQPKNLSCSSYNPKKAFNSRRIYKKPEEELAELEAEFAKDEKEKEKNFKRLDFSEDGDEWSAIAKYNRKLYEDQIKYEKMKDEELKKRNKADLDLQIRQRLKQEYENELKEKEYDKIMEEHQKEMDELERKKQDEKFRMKM